ncbi:MAG: hypothetical protein ABII18_06280 [bacterium]|nr:hypothetical protein [bacterium]MBU1918912.1 hypothetical protein [bacterium]
MRVFLLILCSLTIILCSMTLHAKSSGRIMLKLDDLERLVLISKHINLDNTALLDVNYKHPEKNCLCVCDFDQRWGCTTTECNKHNTKCENINFDDY